MGAEYRGPYPAGEPFRTVRTLFRPISIATVALVMPLFSTSRASSADWPMWRADPGRTARVAEKLPDDLSVHWVRKLPPLQAAWRHHRIKFDGGYEPIVSDGRLFLASSLNDSVTAYDATTGRWLWRYYANGPVRFAPVADSGKLYFGSDDGNLYCLNATDGRLIWRFRAVPSSRTVLGNRRVISVWPIRGGPVLADGTLYFAAGVWPFEGVFVYALDPATGKVKWLNDNTGHIFGGHPHNASALGGLTPQGYLLVNGDELVVPCSAARPATFNRHTGELVRFAPPKGGRKPSGWFTALDKIDLQWRGTVRRGEVAHDETTSGDKHEDRYYSGGGVEGLRSRIIAGDRELRFAAPPAGVEGTVHAMAVAGRALFVTTTEGYVYALGENRGWTSDFEPTRTQLDTPDDATAARARSLLERIDIDRGLAIILGADDGKLIECLIRQSSMRFLVVESDVETVSRLRRRWDRAGLYGSRVIIRHEPPTDFTPPPYVASLMLCEVPGEVTDDSKLPESIINALRPFGGVALLGVELQVKAPRGTRIEAEGDWMVVRRSGALPGTTNYSGGWTESRDDLVRAPLGVLWYDDSLGHFKRSPQPLFVDGVMVSQPKDWSRTDRRGYPLRPPTFTDVYTGRRIDPGERLVKGKTYKLYDAGKRQPYVYRAKHLDARGSLHGKRPDPGTRVSPLNGRTEKRDFQKSYGCDGGFDYGWLITMRSGTAAFYDKRVESGTVHISGTRSGCTNSIVPANGLLNLPYFHEGCSCSYALPVALSMVAMPPTHEQWATWGDSAAQDIARLGINFGAPGDRTTDSGTLWLDLPNTGGPSPKLRSTVAPDTAETYYHHSLWIRGGRGWPWVAASGIRGIRSLKIDGLRAERFTVRLTFAETGNAGPGQRTFDVRIQNRNVLRGFDPVLRAGGAFRSFVHEERNVRVSGDGVLRILFRPRTGSTILSGVELGTDALPLAPVPELEERETETLLKGQ